MFGDCDELIGLMFNARLPSIFLFRNDADKQKTPKLDKTFLSMAKQFRTKIMFCKADIESEFGKRIIRVANLTKVNSEKNEPGAVILDFVKGFNQWRFEDFFNEFKSLT